MLRHGGAPIWTALTVKTGEITGISVPTGKYGPGPIRTLKNKIRSTWKNKKTKNTLHLNFQCAQFVAPTLNYVNATPPQNLVAFGWDVSACVYVYMCICVYVYMCICVYVYMCVSTCTCVYLCVYMYMRIPPQNLVARGWEVSACVYVYMCICVYMYMCICMCVHVHVYMCNIDTYCIPKSCSTQCS